jgi:hypothetical protein
MRVLFTGTNWLGAVPPFHLRAETDSVPELCILSEMLYKVEK